MHGRDDGQKGQVTAFVVALLAALLLLAGLVTDGGLALAGRLRAMDEAQAAARAGAQALGHSSYRQAGVAILNPAAAIRAAQAYLAATGDPGMVVVEGNSVRVSVQVTQSMQLLTLAGLHTLAVSGQGAAQAAQEAFGGGGTR